MVFCFVCLLKLVNCHCVVLRKTEDVGKEEGMERGMVKRTDTVDGKREREKGSEWCGETLRQKNEVLQKGFSH